MNASQAIKSIFPGWPLRKISAALGVSHETVKNWRDGVYVPHPDKLAAMHYNVYMGRASVYLIDFLDALGKTDDDFSRSDGVLGSGDGNFAPTNSEWSIVGTMPAATTEPLPQAGGGEAVAVSVGTQTAGRPAISDTPASHGQAAVTVAPN